MSERRRRWLAITTRAALGILLLALALVVTWVLMIYQPSPAKRGPQAGRPEVAAFRAQRVDVPRQWRGYGTAEAMRLSDVPARVTATVERIPEAVEAGRAVQQGALLVKLDPGDFQRRVAVAEQQIEQLRAQLAQLEAQETQLRDRLKLERREVELAQNELDRLRRLYEQDVANEQEVDRGERELIVAERAVTTTREALTQIAPRRRQLRAQIESQRNELAQARQDLSRTAIQSPLAGVLEEVDVEVGENVAAGSRVARVVALSPIEVPLRLPASARGGVNVGDPVTLLATDASGQSWEATIARIGPTDDPAARTMPVYVELREQEAAPKQTQRAGLLVPGMFVEGVVTAHRAESQWVVPRRAIRGGRIRVIEDGQVRSRPVRIAWTFEGEVPAMGLPGDEQWAVLVGDLAPGQLVMASASSSVLDGQRVQPVVAGEGDQRSAVRMDEEQGTAEDAKAWRARSEESE